MEKYNNPFNRSITGTELKDWVWHHTHQKTYYSDLAKLMGNVLNLDNDKFYAVKKCGNEVIIKEVEEKGKRYEIPCNH